MWEATGGRTASGPFAGMRQPRRHFRPNLIGSYERELHDWVERLIGQRFAHIVNVGGGSGYYAVGLALRSPESKITVFELHPRARAVIAALAVRNGVAERLSLLGACAAESLREALGSGFSTLTVMDVEGFEKELLDPSIIPALTRTTMLVETHDLLVEGCADTIRRRFSATHRISECPAIPRSFADYPPALLPTLRLFFPGAARESISEFRGGPQLWLLLDPLDH